MPEPLGHFLTWVTYGTRLHGDVRGTVDRDHKTYGTPYVAHDEVKRSKRIDDLGQQPFLIDPKARGVLVLAIESHADIRKWHIHALNVRTNHIHLVVSGTAAPSRALNEFKAYCTRHLRSEKLIAADRKVWARGGSTRWLWTSYHLDRACWYTRHAQGPDLPVDWRGDDGEDLDGN